MANEPVVLEELLEPIPYVNENSYAYNILDTFKNSEALLAVVIDEYGIPQGIISMKDIVSALMGSNEGVDNIEESNIRQREDGTYIVDGRIQITDFMEHFQIFLNEEEEEEIGNITTLGGLVFLLLDHVPVEGESIIFQNHQLEVLDMDGHRVDKVLIQKIAKSTQSVSENTD